MQCSAESSKPAICSEKLQRLQGHVSVVSLPSRSCDGDVSNSFRCNAPVIAAISAALSPLCRLSPAELQYFQFPVGRLAADERAECRAISISVLIEHRCRAAAAAAAGRVLSTITPLSSSSPVLHGRRRHRHAVPCRLRLCCQ